MKSRLAGYEAKARVDDDELTAELKSDIKQTDLKVVGVLGKGSFGTVMLVTLKNDACMHMTDHYCCVLPLPLPLLLLSSLIASYRHRSFNMT
jgi:hypothetical protein